jgi:hypothetical protein
MLRLTGHAAWMGERERKFGGGNLLENGLLRRTKRRREGNNITDIWKTGCVSTTWMEAAKNLVQWRDLVIVVLKLQC